MTPDLYVLIFIDSSDNWAFCGNPVISSISFFCFDNKSENKLFDKSAKRQQKAQKRNRLRATAVAAVVAALTAEVVVSTAAAAPVAAIWPSHALHHRRPPMKPTLP